jgi:HK97 family phage prohead protease
MSNEAKKDRTEWLEAQGVKLRQFSTFEIRAGGEADAGALYVEGVAAPFNSPCILYSYDGIDYKEVIDARAFDGADLSDVIFNYNHSGKVVARTRNTTLKVWIEPDGLHVRAKLDGTKDGRDLYEEIRGGYIDRMSFAFSVTESSYNIDEHTRTILKVRKVYDVSAVDIPAYDTTSISARNSFKVEIEREERQAAAAALRKELLQDEISQTIKFYGGKQ